MRKLKLDVETLQVESFAALPHVTGGGTVHGRIEYQDDSTGCDGGGWGSLFGSCNCPSVGTCIGPTYCCPPTWRPTCADTCVTCHEDPCIT